MKIFLSWSGDRSKEIATALKQYIPDVIQVAQPWLSSEDIDKGVNWPTVLAENLEECHFGIICLTPENLRAPFLFFEAGALSKLRSQANVCTLLMDVADRDLSTPFVNLQNTKIHDKEDVRRLFDTMNNALPKSGKEPLSADVLGRAFDRIWPEMSNTFSEISCKPSTSDPVPKRSDSDVLSEILEILRSQQREERALNERSDLNARKALMNMRIATTMSQIDSLERRMPEALEDEVDEILPQISALRTKLITFQTALAQLGASSGGNWSGESAPLTITLPMRND